MNVCSIYFPQLHNITNLQFIEWLVPMALQKAAEKVTSTLI